MKGGKSNQAISGLVDLTGRIPPQAVDVEEIVIGSFMLHPAALEYIDLLLPECFYRQANGIVFEAMRNLTSRSEPVDLVTVKNELLRLGKLETIGGPYALTSFTDRVASVANTEYHVRIILQAYLRRKTIEVCRAATAKAYDESEDIFETVDDVGNNLVQISEVVLGKTEFMEWPEHVRHLAEKVKKLASGEVKTTGIPTGNDKLNSCLGGWQKGDLIIIAGRPGQGKTTRALNFVRKACEDGHNVILFSLEMSSEQITRKMMSDWANVYDNRLLSGEATDEDIASMEAKKPDLMKLPFHVIDKATVSPSFINKIVKSRKKKSGVDMVVVDYVQLMQPDVRRPQDSRDAVIGSISRAMKVLAKDYGIPVVILSQLNREVEKRIDKRPILSDLKESGALEADADVVIGLYRPSYYHRGIGNDRDYKDEPISEAQYRRISELHVLKNRSGPPDKYIIEQFFGEYSRFISEGYQKPQGDGTPLSF